MRSRNCLPFAINYCSPPVFGGVRVTNLFAVVLVVVVLCLVYPMLPVSLDCPFLITASDFSNVYLM